MNTNFSIKDYKKLIQSERKRQFTKPYDFIYEHFIKFNFDKNGKSFFMKHASDIVEKLRNSCWDSFSPQEKIFTSEMLKKLADQKIIENLSPIDAVSWFVESYPEHIYSLALSNTQSRRSRAGKEFEAIIELLLIGAEIPIDSQGTVGKKFFMDKGLGKMVDLVSPSVTEYLINKRNSVLVSAKTTLRERWQEVPEEMSRTGAKEMFLATLDEKISQDVLSSLYEANIHITTTKSIKQTSYPNNDRVLTFEDLLDVCSKNLGSWANFNYPPELKQQAIDTLKKQIIKHTNHPFVENYYRLRLDKLSQT